MAWDSADDWRAARAKAARRLGFKVLPEIQRMTAPEGPGPHITDQENLP